MQPDSLENRLLQLCTVRRSIRHHSEAPASPEQRGAYRSTSASPVRRQLAASEAALAACWTAHQVHVGRADVQDTADVISAVSEPAHLVAHQRTQHLIVVRATAVRAISTDIICQTIVQHCCTTDLEPTATCCVKVWICLLSNPDLKLICFLLLSANYSTYLFRQRLSSRLTSLWRYINFVLLLLLL